MRRMADQRRRCGLGIPNLAFYRGRGSWLVTYTPVDPASVDHASTDGASPLRRRCGPDRSEADSRVGISKGSRSGDIPAGSVEPPRPLVLHSESAPQLSRQRCSTRTSATAQRTAHGRTVQARRSPCVRPSASNYSPNRAGQRSKALGANAASASFNQTKHRLAAVISAFGLVMLYKKTSLTHPCGSCSAHRAIPAVSAAQPRIKHSIRGTAGQHHRPEPHPLGRVAVGAALRGYTPGLRVLEPKTKRTVRTTRSTWSGSTPRRPTGNHKGGGKRR